MDKKKFALTTAQVAACMAVLTVVTKVLAFVREMALANYFGAGVVTDAYAMAISIPNSLLAAAISAIGTSFMPAFSKKIETEGEDAAHKLTSKLLSLLFALVAIVILFGEIFTGGLVKIFAPGFESETRTLTIFFLRFALFILFYNVINYTYGAFLNYKNIFIPQIIYGFAQNSILIIFVVLAAKINAKLLIAGSLVGGFCMSLPHILRSKKEGFKFSFDLKIDDSVKTILKEALPIFIGGYVTQINLAIDRMLASKLVSGSVSALNYANQIINTVSSLSISIFIVILYPRLNKAYVTGGYKDMSRLSQKGVNVISILAMPFTLGIIFYASPIIKLVFQRGAFDETAADLTAGALIFYAIGLLFTSLNALITKVYYTMHDTLTCVKCSVTSVCINIALNFALVGPMQHKGLALATSISQFINTCLLLYTFKKRYKYVNLIESWGKLFKMLLFSTVSVGASYLLYTSFVTSIGLIPSIALGIVVAAGLYAAFLIIFKFEELVIIKDLIKK